MRLRRTSYDIRVETMPLIDVVFLLLTFFIYATVLMQRVEVLPFQTASVDGAAPATTPPAATISVDAGGDVFLDREPVERAALVAMLRERLASAPDTVVYLAVDEVGQRDRLPDFLRLYGSLAEAGIPVGLVSGPEPPDPDPPSGE